MPQGVEVGVRSENRLNAIIPKISAANHVTLYKVMFLRTYIRLSSFWLNQPIPLPPGGGGYNIFNDIIIQKAINCSKVVNQSVLCRSNQYSVRGSVLCMSKTWRKQENQHPGIGKNQVIYMFNLISLLCMCAH